MEINSFSPGYSITEQLIKYAEDLAKVYKTAKQNQKDFEAANRQLTKYANDLNKTVSELKATYRELQEAYLDTIHRLVLASEYKDEDTGDHIVRMSRYSALLAEKLRLPPDEVKSIRYAAPMHDVGKIGTPDHILLKSGKLTDQEFDLMKTHTTIGAKILGNSKAKMAIRYIVWVNFLSFRLSYKKGSVKKQPYQGQALRVLASLTALTALIFHTVFEIATAIEARLPLWLKKLDARHGSFSMTVFTHTKQR